MSVDYSRFKGYSYIRINGINQKLIDELLEGLEKGMPQGIELEDIDQPGTFEYLPLRDAAELILAWFIDVKDGKTPDQNVLTELLNKKSYTLFARLLKIKLTNEINDPYKLQRVALEKNLTDLRNQRTPAYRRPTGHYDPGEAVDIYIKTYNRVLTLARSGATMQQLLRNLTLAGLPAGKTDLTQQLLSAFISQNLTRLAAAARTGDDPEIQDYAVAKELGRLIKAQNPDLLSYHNLLGDRTIAHNLRSYTEHLANSYVQSGGDLDELEKEGYRSAASLSELILNQAELQQSLEGALSFITSGAERSAFAKEIIRSINKSYGQDLSADDIIKLAGQTLGADPNQIQHIASSLKAAGFEYQIELNHNEIAILVNSHHLTRGEKNLLKNGLNPFLLHSNKKDLASRSSDLLANYNKATSSNFATLQLAYENELKLPKPNQDFLRRARSQLNQHWAVDHLTKKERRLLGRSRFGTTLLELRSLYYQTDRQFWDKWIEIERIVTGDKLIDVISDFSKRITIPKTNIPIFRLNSWIYDQIQLFKKRTTTKLLTKTSKSTSFWGKFLHWNLTQYKIGGYTVDGAIFHSWHKAWGSGVKWVLKKTGVSATLQSTKQLFLKFSGKLIAQAGTKLAAAIAAAATVIGTIVSVVAVIGTILDFIKGAWKFVKEFIRNAEFRKSVLKSGFTIGAIFTALGALFNLQFAAILLGPIILLTQALIISIAVLFFVSSYQFNLNSTFSLDSNIRSGVTQLITNIVCEEDATNPGNNTGSNKVVLCASCLVKYLAQCYGQSVTGTKIKSQGISCIIASVINEGSASAIEASATKYNYLQCVGFARAAAVCGGGDLPGQAVASDYIRQSTPGYRFSSGAGSCVPGDFGIIDGSVGHIFVVSSNNNGTIDGIDANFVCDGCVSPKTSFPSSRVAGCLKRN